MGNLFQRLFSSEPREPGKRSRHKVNLNDSKKSRNSPAQSQTINHEDVSSDLSPIESDQTQPEESPFHRDFLPAHQPLVSLEKGRPRRSNIRRSSRMNTSMGKGDNVVRPSPKILTTVPSYVEPDYPDDPSETNNRTDSTFTVSHSSQSDEYRIHDDAETNRINSELEQTKSKHNDTVDDMSPNERVKVAKSRISQMFIKREQQQKHTSVVESDASHTNGYALNTDYVRVYENIDNYGHYKMSDNRHAEHEQNHRHVANSNEPQDNEDDEHKAQNTVQDNHDTMESDQPDESSKPEVVPRRKPKMHLGNPMLIDELKKRQSTLYQVTE